MTKRNTEGQAQKSKERTQEHVTKITCKIWKKKEEISQINVSRSSFVLVYVYTIQVRIIYNDCLKNSYLRIYIS